MRQDQNISLRASVGISGNTLTPAVAELYSALVVYTAPFWAIFPLIYGNFNTLGFDAKSMFRDV